MKIGILGGSFNPPHNMHKKIGLELIKNGYVDKVIYIPTGDNYNKKGLVSFNDRYNMVKLMLIENDLLSLSDIGNDPDYQYTYQVLDYYSKIYVDDEIFFICGLDNLNEFDLWREYKYIFDNYKLLVINRDGFILSDVLYKYRDYLDRIIISDVVLEFISSTYIRDNILGDAINYLDSNVYDYIVRNGLYTKKRKL